MGRGRSFKTKNEGKILEGQIDTVPERNIEAEEAVPRPTSSKTTLNLVQPLSGSQQNLNAVESQLKKEGPESPQPFHNSKAGPKEESASSKNSMGIEIEMTPNALPTQEFIRFKRITIKCTGKNEQKRREAFDILSTATDLTPMLPWLVKFISDGVLSAVEPDFKGFAYRMRMVKRLLKNPNLNLEQHATILSISVYKCFIDPNLTPDPNNQAHWLLRDLSARLMSQLCKAYSNQDNNIAGQLKEAFALILSDSDSPFESIYGAILGLEELGKKVTKAVLRPKVIGEIGLRMESYLEQVVDGTEHPATDAASFNKIEMLIGRVGSRIIARKYKSRRYCPEKYNKRFGFLGPVLFSNVGLILARKRRHRSRLVQTARRRSRRTRSHSLPSSQTEDNEGSG